MKVRILGKQFTVTERSGEPDLGREYNGRVYADKQEIYLFGDLPRDSKSEVFIHECIHGIDKNMGLKLSEEQVQGLGVGLYALLSDNRDLFYDLMKELKKEQN